MNKRQTTINLIYIMSYLINRTKYKKIRDYQMPYLLYLVDWYGALCFDNKLTGISWECVNYNLSIDNLHLYIAVLNDWRIAEKDGYIYIKTGCNCNKLNYETMKIIDYVINLVESKKFSEIINLVFMTLPITSISNVRYKKLDLLALAYKFREHQFNGDTSMR